MKYKTNSEEENQKLVEEFLKNISPKESGATVVGLYGNLGAGKTTFTKYVAKSLGVEDIITSPTFVIEKIYELPKNNSRKNFSHLIHIDTYRLEGEQELQHLGWGEIISDPENLILIEWPEKVSGIMPEHIKINFSHLKNENSREIEVVV